MSGLDLAQPLSPAASRQPDAIALAVNQHVELGFDVLVARVRRQSHDVIGVLNSEQPVHRMTPRVEKAISYNGLMIRIDPLTTRVESIC